MLAVMSSILTGHETIILTRDNDLLEQFYKLIYLIDTHYVSMLVADEYVKQPMNFPAMDMPSVTETQNLFDGDNNELIWLPGGYLKSPALLPTVFEFVQLYCFCLAKIDNRERVSFLNFTLSGKCQRCSMSRGPPTDKTHSYLENATVMSTLLPMWQASPEKLQSLMTKYAR